MSHEVDPLEGAEGIVVQLSDSELLAVIFEVINLEDELGLQEPASHFAHPELFEHPELLDPLHDSADEVSENEGLQIAYVILFYLG